MKKIFFTFIAVLAVTAAFASGVVATAIGTNPSCHGAGNGSATALASGGIGPYGFAWTGPSGYTATGASISGLYAGTYVVTATDSSDMSTAAYTVVLSDPAALATAVTGNGPLCAGACETLTGTATGGTGPYTYSWSPATGLSAINISNPTACPTSTTTYVLTVTDNNSCLASTSVTVIVNPLPPVAITASTNATCGACNGTATATGAMTYSWSSGGFTTAHPTTMCAGTYTVTGCSSSGCCATATTTITNLSSAPALTPSTVIPASCGACNGSATVTPTGGTPPYTYDWVPGTPTGDGTPTATGLCGISTFTVSIIDAAGCSAATSLTIYNTSSITAINTTTTNSSCSVANGSISITSVTGGTAPYTYSVDGSPYGAASTFTGLTGGSHVVTVRDSYGCVQSNTVNVYAPAGPAGPAGINYTTVNSNCTSSTGEINISGAIGGMPPYQYAMDASGYSPMTSYTGLATGTHTIVVMDGNGCMNMQYANILNNNPPVITTDSTNNISCSGSTPGNIYVSVTGGTPGYAYLWTPGGTTTQDLTNITAIGTYVLNVTDAGGCTSTHNYSITNISSLHATVTSTYGNCGTMATITAVATGGTPPYSYSWNTLPVQTTPTAINLPGGNYHCSITDANGCVTGVYQNAYNSCFNIIKGRVYNDVNGNCAYDAGDSPIVGRIVSLTAGGSGYGYTDLAGNYTIYTTSLTNTVTHSQPLYSNVVCPAGNSQSANLTTPGDTIYNVDFADQYIAGMNDLVVNYYPGTARPGFMQTGLVYYQNVGTTTISGVTINMTHDSILHFNYSSPVATSYSYPTVNWSIGTLGPGQSGYIYVYDSVPTIPMGGYIGRVLNYSAEIDPITGDQTPLNNYTAPGTSTSVSPITVIVAAWDPNAKEVSPAGDILATDSLLHYTIHFQNTGTDTAFTVVLKDTLSQYLDPATVEPGMASHPYTFNIAFNGELTWAFDHILLPDSAANQDGSHGFATFTVKQRAGNMAGTHIDNTADIYFDYNQAVVTNTVTNAIVDLTTGIETTSSNNAVKVFPNPFSDNTTFVIQSDKMNETYSFEMTDVLGKTVQSIKGISGKQFTVSRNDLQDGIYFYKIFSSGKTIGMGKLMIK